MYQGKSLLDIQNVSSTKDTQDEVQSVTLLNEALKLEIVNAVLDEGLSLMKEAQLRTRLKDMGVTSRRSQNAYITEIVNFIKLENEELKQNQKEKIRYELQVMYNKATDTKTQLMILDRMIKLDGLAEPQKHLVAKVNVDWGGSATNES